MLGSLGIIAHKQPCEVGPAGQVWRKSRVQMVEEAGERKSYMGAEEVFINRQKDSSLITQLMNDSEL